MARHVGTAGVIAMMASLVASPVQAMPPVETTGKLSSTLRLNRPSDGEPSRAVTHTADMTASSYIWQPWFGLWRARGAFSLADTKADGETASELVTGDVEVNLFHRSHFPFTAFASVRDSRVEAGSITEAISDVRTIRLGLTQQYQDLAGNAFYFGSYDRDEAEDLSNGSRSVSNRVLVSADKTGEVHSYSGVGTVTTTETSIAGSEMLVSQLVGSHSYRPSAAFTLDSSVNAAVSTAESDFFATEANAFGASTRAEWQPQARRLRVRGDLSFNSESIVTEGQPELFRDTLRARASARYELSDQASVFGEVGADRQATERGDSLLTFQSLSANYNALPTAVRGFEYSWGAAAGVANQTTTGEGDSHSLSAALNHSVTRHWIPDISGPVPVVFSAGQEMRQVSNDTEGNQTQLVHRASLSATRSDAGGSGFAQLTVLDSRSFGNNENGIFTVNGALSVNRALSRYRSLDATASYNYFATTANGNSVESDVSSAEVRYRDSRLFDVSRLDFESRLRLVVAGALAGSAGLSSSEIEWDNRLNYRIGLLEVSARAGIVQSGERRNLLFHLTTTRRF